MTPKEKAKELVEKFKNRSIELGETHSQLMAEANALIAVDEIINSSPSLPILGKGGYFSEDIELSKNYWQEVKKEIEKL